MMNWLTSKKINWKAAIISTHEKLIKMDMKQGQYSENFIKHCTEDDNRYREDKGKWTNAVAEIKKQIKEIDCPKGHEIDDLVRKKIVQNNEIGELSSEFRKTKGSVDKMLQQTEGEKEAWRKIKFRMGMIAIVISIVAGTTKMFGLW